MGTAKLALEEVVGFDEAIQRAVEVTDSSETLIVVTADHSHVVSMGGYPSRGNPILGLYTAIVDVMKCPRACIVLFKTDVSVTFKIFIMQ